MGQLVACLGGGEGLDGEAGAAAGPESFDKALSGGSGAKTEAHAGFDKVEGGICRGDFLFFVRRHVS